MTSSIKRGRQLKRIGREYAASLAIGIFCLIITAHISGYGYSGYDMAVLYSTQNLLARGQDFANIPFVLPLIFGGALKLFSSLFGSTYFTPFIASSSLYAILLGLGNTLYNRAVRRGRDKGPLALIVLTTALSLNLLNPGHLWHSDMTSMLAISLLWACYCAGPLGDTVDTLAMGGLAALTLLGKPNLSPLYFLFYSLYLATLHARQNPPAVGKLLAQLLLPIALAIAIASCLASDLQVNLIDYLKTIRMLSSERGNPWMNPDNFLKFLPEDATTFDPVTPTSQIPFLTAELSLLLIPLLKLLLIGGFYLACLFIPLRSLALGFSATDQGSERPASRFSRPLTQVLGFCVLSGLLLSFTLGEAPKNTLVVLLIGIYLSVLASSALLTLSTAVVAPAHHRRDAAWDPAAGAVIHVLLCDILYRDGQQLGYQILRSQHVPAFAVHLCPDKRHHGQHHRSSAASAPFSDRHHSRSFSLHHHGLATGAHDHRRPASHPQQLAVQTGAEPILGEQLSQQP